ncbi:MAG: alpha/beta hydrolase [Desulfosalsimonadaceae bacterium]
MKLVFIHGSGAGREAWRYQLEAFPDAEAVNLPGHPDGELCSSVEQYAEWLRGHVRSLGYRDALLVGHSLGGGIALSYALNYPRELAGVVTIGSGAKLRVHPQFLQYLEEAVADPAKLKEGLLFLYEGLDPEIRQVLQERTMENGAEAALNDMRACDHFDIIDRLGEIMVPTLALAGSEDNMTPPKFSHFLAEKMPEARAEIIAGGSHMVFAEKPGLVNQKIREFVEELRGRH